MKFSITLVAVTLFFVVTAVAGPGTQHLGPFVVNTTDGGSCGNSWANDTFGRQYTIMSNGGGNFSIKEQDQGSFVTIAGQSPGACETASSHGSLVSAGISGGISGSADFTVNSATYNPHGCDADPSVCSTRTGFVNAVFPGAGGNMTFTAFNFEYSSVDQSLAYRKWQDKSDQAVNDRFTGDIANQ
jgi:hypothetical protein